MKKFLLAILLINLSACTNYKQYDSWERFDECIISKEFPKEDTLILENVQVSYQLEKDGILLIRRVMSTGDFGTEGYNIDNVVCRNKE